MIHFHANGEDISLTQTVWAENIYIISISIESFTTIMNELTAAIEIWKDTIKQKGGC